MPVIAAPLPLAAIPVRLTVLSLTQVNVVPGNALGFVMFIWPIAVAEQIVCVAGAALTVGPGFTLTVAVVVLEQPAKLAVIVNTVVCSTAVLFINVPEIGDPDPLAAIPVRLMILVLVQVNTVPVTAFGFVITILLINPHTVWLVLVALTVGIGFTVTVRVVVDEQVPAVAVIVNVVVIAADVLFVNVPEILDPVPLLAIPESPPGVVLVQLNVVPGNEFGFVITI